MADGGAPIFSAAQLASAYDGLVADVSSSRQLRRACPRLFRDVLAVLTGLRPAFLLDYGALSPQQLAAAVASLMHTLRLALHACLGVGVLQDCCCLVRTDSLADPLAGGANSLQLMSFAAAPGGSGSVQAQWAAGQQRALALSQLSDLRHLLCTQVSAGAAAASAAASLPIVSLDGPAVTPLAMPTVSGYLLGYPALYLLYDLETAQAASRCLSCSSLQLHTASAALQGAPQSEDSTLSGFSVPAELAGEAAWQRCWEAWVSLLRQRVVAAQALGWPWSRVAVKVAAQPPRPVAL